MAIVALFSACESGLWKNTPTPVDKGNMAKMKALERESAMATYYVLVVDTGSNYYTLRDEMYHLSNEINMLVDTMGRYYDIQKNLIVSDCDAQNIHEFGDYLPRNAPSNFLSLEHFSTYYSYVGKSTMALIGGIYESELSAEVDALKIQHTYPKSYVLKASVYTGE
jgi:hypothetical protein